MTTPNGKVITAPPQTDNVLALLQNEAIVALLQNEDVLALLQDKEIVALLQNSDVLALCDIAGQLINIGHIEDVWWFTTQLYHLLGLRTPKEVQIQVRVSLHERVQRQLKYFGFVRGPMQAGATPTHAKQGENL